MDRLVRAGNEAIPVWRALLRVKPTLGERLSRSLSGSPRLRNLALGVFRPPPWTTDRLRMEALQHFDVRGPRAVEALPELVALLEVDDHASGAAHAIAQLGSRAATAVPALERLLRRGGPLPDRVKALRALVTVASGTDEVARICSEILAGSDEYLRLDAAGYLLRFSSNSPEVEAVLVEALENQPVRSGIRAAEFLGGAGTNALAIQPVTSAIRAAQILGGAGTNALAMLPALKKAAESSDPMLRSVARDALDRIDRTGRTSTPRP